ARLLGVPRETASSLFAPEDVHGAARINAFLAGFDTARRPPLGVIHYELPRWAGPPRAPRSGAQALAAGAVAAGMRTALCVGSARTSELATALAEAGMTVAEAGEADARDAAALASQAGPVLLVQASGLSELPAALAGLVGHPVLLLRAPPAGQLGAEDD